MVFIVRISAAFALLMALSTPSHAFLTEGQIARRQKEMASMDIGKRIAGWAEAFIGTSYDTDPLGAYVSERAVVVDDRVDCMYLTFRSVELAASTDPADAVQAALDKRFLTRGELAPDGTVLNYDDRFQYAMDMISSNKWGSDVTGDLVPASTTTVVPGSRGNGPAGHAKRGHRIFCQRPCTPHGWRDHRTHRHNHTRGGRGLPHPRQRPQEQRWQALGPCGQGPACRIRPAHAV